MLFETTDMETNLIWPGNSLPFPRFATWIKLFSTIYGTETQNGDEFCQHELFNTAVRHTDSIVCTKTYTHYYRRPSYVNKNRLFKKTLFYSRVNQRFENSKVLGT